MSSKKEKRLSDQKGLTLPELMITISIVMILSIIGVASFSDSLPRYRLNATSRDLLSDMRMARQQAATENRQYAIQFLSTTSYNVVHGDKPLIQSSVSVNPPIKSVTAQTGVSWTMPATMPLFDPNGLIGSWVPSSNTVSAAPPASIVLIDNKVPPDTKSIVIGTSGRIRIQ
jgi:prepilin-type N-terminal cleavage/methylation domain-containing protein